MKLDDRISDLTECDACHSLLLFSEPDPDGYVICPECQHAHPATRRAKLADARAVLAEAKAKNPGDTSAYLNGQVSL